MMNLLRFAQLAVGDVTTVPTDDPCGGFGIIVKIIRQGVFPILQIGIPIVLIVLGTIDLGKAVIASDEKQVKEAQGKLMKRCIYAVAVFFIVTIVNLVMSILLNLAGDTIEGVDSWRECWNSVGGK